MYSKYTCHVFWAWNDNITYEGIDAQLRQFYTAGVGGVVIHARAGLKIEYLSDGWLDLFAYAVEKAKEIGIKVVIYDENGWPSGFAGGKVVALNGELSMKQLVFSEGVPCTEEILAGYKKLADNEYVLGGNDLFVCVKRNMDYVDLTDRRATETFIDLTHKRYKEKIGDEFGKTVTALFTDEPQYSTFENFQYPYSYGFDEEFYKFTGFDLKRNLWKLYVGDVEFKRKYLNFFADRFYKNYTCVVADWCKANHLEFTGHFSAEDGIISQACGNGGAMRHYRAMQRPGIDFLGRRLASPVLLKQLESVKNQEDKKIVLSESYGGAGWGATLEDYSHIWFYQAAFGVNQLCAHLSPYSITGVRKRDYPGFFSDVQPWWEHAKEFFGRIERLNELLSSGKCKNKIAVLHPVNVAMGQRDFSAEQRALSTEFRVLTENLIDCQLDFDYVDEASVLSGKIIDNKLCVGNCSYEVVIMLEASVTETIMEKLSAVQTGVVGKDIFNRREAIIRWFENIGYHWNVVFTDGENISDGLITTYKERADGTAFVYAFNRCKDTAKTMYLCGDFKGVKEICFDGGTQALHSTLCARGAFCKVELPAGGAKIFEFTSSNGVLSATNEKIRDMTILGAKLLDDNCLTIDRACYSFNGIDYSDSMDVVLLTEQVYKNGQRKIFIKYSFSCEFESKKTVTLFTENGYENILVNGKLPQIVDKKFFSENLQAYDVTDCIRNGNNDVVMQFMLPIERKTDENWEFESLRNIYCLPIEIESIYLCGDFFVTATVKAATPKTWIAEAPFTITESKPIDYTQITGSGAPFYRGRVEIFGEVEKTEGEELFLQVSFHGSMATVSVDGEYFGSVFGNEKINVTEKLKNGKNNVVVTVYSTNRNTLGAHHHYRGEVKMTGRNTFEGKRGFEDFVHASVDECTFTDKYSLVRFGLDKIKIIRTTKTNNKISEGKENIRRLKDAGIF